VLIPTGNETVAAVTAGVQRDYERQRAAFATGRLRVYERLTDGSYREQDVGDGLSPLVMDGSPVFADANGLVGNVWLGLGGADLDAKIFGKYKDAKKVSKTKRRMIVLSYLVSSEADALAMWRERVHDLLDAVIGEKDCPAYTSRGSVGEIPARLQTKWQTATDYVAQFLATLEELRPYIQSTLSIIGFTAEVIYRLTDSRE
jgi:hypothetical protein